MGNEVYILTLRRYLWVHGILSNILKYINVFKIFNSLKKICKNRVYVAEAL